MESVFSVDTVEQFKTITKPGRLRILDTLRNGKELTIKQIAEQLNHEPHKLYYHVKELIKVGVLRESKAVARGHWIEKYYQMTAKILVISPKLNQALNDVSPEEAQDISNTQLLDFVAYINETAIEFVKNHDALILKYEQEEHNTMPISTVSTRIYCTNAELTELTSDIFHSFDKYQEARDGTAPYRLFSLIIPNPDLNNSEGIEEGELELTLDNTV